jgi:hypothetical protein
MPNHLGPTPYNEDQALKTIKVECSCANCAHGDTRRESVIAYLKARGISQITDAHGAPVDGENTIARDFKWGEIVHRLEEIALCRIPEREGGPGCEMVMLAFCCLNWAEDKGRIFVPQGTAVPSTK